MSPRRSRRNSGAGWCLLSAELRDVHPEERERRVCADIRREIEPGDLWVEQVGIGRLFGAVQELFPIDDLHDAARTGAVAEIDPVDFRAEGNRAVKLGGDRARRSRLLARKTKVADEHRVRWIAQIIDLRHAACAPRRI